MKTDRTDLRRRVKARLVEKDKGRPEAAGKKMTAAETARLVQELQIHQIELEMQNEALRQAREEAEAGRERYLDLHNFAPVGYFTLDRSPAAIPQLVTASAGSPSSMVPSDEPLS